MWETLAWVLFGGHICVAVAIVFFRLGDIDGYRRGHRHGRSHVKSEY